MNDNEQVMWWTEIRQVDHGDHKANGVVLVRCVRRPQVDCDRHRIDASEPRAAQAPEPQEPQEPKEPRDDTGDEPPDDDEGSGSGLGDMGF